MMIRGDWRDFRDDPPTSGPILPGGGCAGGRLDGRSDDTAGGSDDAVSLTQQEDGWCASASLVAFYRTA